MERKKALESELAAIVRKGRVGPPEVTPPPTEIPAGNQILKPILITLFLFFILGVSYKGYTFYTAPTGKITSPGRGEQTDRLVAIQGFTKNIPLDRRFIWVAVDLPELGLCWPKRPISKCNHKFTTKLYEGGPYKKYTVSLYAVDHTYNEQILKWLDACRKTKTETGFTMLPDRYRLDSISLILQQASSAA